MCLCAVGQVLSGTGHSLGLSLCSTHLVFLRGIACIRFVVIQLNKFRVMGQIFAKVAIMVSGNTEDIARTEL